MLTRRSARRPCPHPASEAEVSGAWSRKHGLEAGRDCKVSFRKRDRLNTALVEATYVVILAIVVAAALWTYVLPRSFHLELPIAYGEGDSLYDAHFVKRTLEARWYPWQTPRLGAPFEATEYDMPEAQWLHYAVFKLIGLFWSDWVVVGNVYALSPFFLIAFSAYGVLRWMRLEAVWAMLGGIVFAFQPYHFYRLVPLNHTFLAAYWNVPIAILLALRSWQSPVRLPSPAAGVGVAVAIVATAAGGVYYAFFACFLIVVAGTAAACVRRSWRAAIPAAVTVVAITLVAGIQLTPSVFYWLQNGHNPAALVRWPSQSEVYGLKPIQLLVPQPNHRSAAARYIATYYSEISPLVNENTAASLGGFASAGFLLLLAVAVRRFLAPRGEESISDRLAILTMAALSLATVGGLGAAVAWAALREIRAYNRLSIFIAFLSIAALLLAIQALSRQAVSALITRRVVAALSAVVIALLALWDQTTPFDQGRLLASFQSDREFAGRVETALPPGTAVYQLPYHPYPEGGRLHELRSYDLLRGYLHSRELRWSYGGMKGRPGDLWLHALSNKPLKVQLDEAVAAGFGAVYVDRRGYSDRGESIEAMLRTHVGQPLATDQAGNRAVYRLTSVQR